MQLKASLIALMALAACGTKPAVSSNEICDNRKDDNGDGKVDCLDPKCFQNAVCRVMTREDCTNTVDDDGNGLTDCADSTCEGESCGTGCLCLGGVRMTGAGGGGSNVGGGASAGGAAGGTSSGGGTGAGVGGGGSGTGGGSAGSGVAGGTAGSGVAGGSGGTGGGLSAAGGTGGGAAPRETNCSNNLDDDGDNATDCDDSDCTGVTCGMGCTCALNRRVETNCSDNLDNDGDTQRDCADSDCVGAGTELCDDGIDNTCDRAIDCGDSKCISNGACLGVTDGKPCLSSNQCASGRCLSEQLDGIPNGQCTNATACNLTTNAGCNGGRCVTIAGVPTCLAGCSGTGLGATGRCRAGFTCVDADSDPNNNNNTCRALCTSDSECSGSGAGYGCNPWSKLCQSRDRGLLRYGAACTAGTQCEGGVCMTGADFPNGYCLGVCRGDTRNCGPDGYCSFDTSFGDNLGFCYQSCMGAGTTSTCRATGNYKCWPMFQGGPTACICIGVGGPCVIGGNSDCCSGLCQFGTCR